MDEKHADIHTIQRVDGRWTWFVTVFTEDGAEAVSDPRTEYQRSERACLRLAWSVCEQHEVLTKNVKVNPPGGKPM